MTEIRFGRLVPLVLVLSWALACTGASAQSSRTDSVEVIPIDHRQLLDIIKHDSGNVVLVNAWATWCKPCKEEMPALLKLKRDFEKKGLRLILLSADDIDVLDTSVRPMLKQFGVTFPTYIMADSSEEVFLTSMNPKWTGAFALPTSFIFDRKGKLAETMVGGKKYETFKNILEKTMRWGVGP
ncbi:MAG: TlpA family protein disulfide reductase [Ignavibacteria bacterium]|nr:TlpA family protein disulfide reductase [Ignavibacteria bacterium]MBI3765182.1 TlpA family protein disulfide reductase [Ignavibacteriales bacterium]